MVPVASHIRAMRRRTDFRYANRSVKCSSGKPQHSLACSSRPMGDDWQQLVHFVQRSGYKILAQTAIPPRRVRAAIALSNVAAQPFLSRDARRLPLASGPDVRAVFAVPQPATRAGSWAGAHRRFALLALRTDPLKLSARVGDKK